MKRLFFSIALIAFSLSAEVAAQSYEFTVEHEHSLRNCRGKLIITKDGIEYQTEDKNDSRKWRYRELRQIKVDSTNKLELVSYEDQRLRLGRDRIFKFRLLDREITPQISALLVERAAHPPVTSVLPETAGEPVFSVPVKHLHRFGGCTGSLKIYPDRLVYLSEDLPSDSRFWRYSDLQGFSQSERYRFEIGSFEDKLGGPKAYNFQLREDLPEGAYDYVWERVYPSRSRK